MDFPNAAVFASTCAILCGCGPTISEQRMVYSPPLPATCDVKVVNVRMETMMQNPDYEMLGNIVVQSSGNLDPFNAEMLSELRPRVCKMGGQAISLGMSSNVGGGGGATVYAVLKPKGDAAASPTPASSETAPKP